MFALSGKDTQNIWLALTLYGNIYDCDFSHRLLTHTFAPQVPGTRVAPAPTSAQVDRIMNALFLFHGYLSTPGYPAHDDDGNDVTEQAQDDVRDLVTRLAGEQGLDVTQIPAALAEGKRVAGLIPLSVPAEAGA